MSLKYYCDLCLAEISAYQASEFKLSKPSGEALNIRHVCPKCHCKVEQAIMGLIQSQRRPDAWGLQRRPDAWVL